MKVRCLLCSRSTSLSVCLSIHPQAACLPKKPWITLSTLEYIASFQSCTDLTEQEVKQYRNKFIKKLVGRDKKQLVLHHLQDDFHGSAIQQWRCACSVGKDFRPSPSNLINTKGKLVSKPVRAETFADYLADQVWKAPSPEISLTLLPWNRCHKQPTHLPEKNLTSSSARFVSAVALHGPVKVPADLLFRLYLLDHYNHCLQRGEAPASWLHSEVVM